MKELQTNSKVQTKVSKDELLISFDDNKSITLSTSSLYVVTNENNESIFATLDANTTADKAEAKTKLYMEHQISKTVIGYVNINTTATSTSATKETILAEVERGFKQFTLHNIIAPTTVVENNDINISYQTALQNQDKTFTCNSETKVVDAQKGYTTLNNLSIGNYICKHGDISLVRFIVSAVSVANNDDFGIIYSGDSTRISVLGNDADEGDTLSIQSVGEVTGGSVEIDGDYIIFTADNNFSGNIKFTYVVVDSTGNVSEATVIGVVQDNDTVAPDAPIIIDAPETTTTDTTTVEISGEPGAKIFLNGVSTGLLLNYDGSSYVDLNTSTAGENEYVITLKDKAGNESDGATVEINNNRIEKMFEGVTYTLTNNPFGTAVLVTGTIHTDKVIKSVSINEIDLVVSGDSTEYTFDGSVSGDTVNIVLMLEDGELISYSVAEFIPDSPTDFSGLSTFTAGPTVGLQGEITDADGIASVTIEYSDGFNSPGYTNGNIDNEGTHDRGTTYIITVMDDNGVKTVSEGVL